MEKCIYLAINLFCFDHLYKHYNISIAQLKNNTIQHKHRVPPVNCVSIMKRCGAVYRVYHAIVSRWPANNDDTIVTIPFPGCSPLRSDWQPSDLMTTQPSHPTTINEEHSCSTQMTLICQVLSCDCLLEIVHAITLATRFNSTTISFACNIFCLLVKHYSTEAVSVLPSTNM